MINQAAIKRDGVACIADWPVTIRHYYTDILFHTITAGLSSKDQVSQLLDGGLLDKPEFDLIAAYDDFLPNPPANRDRVDILNGATWITFEIKRTPGLLDPNDPMVILTIGSPNI